MVTFQSSKTNQVNNNTQLIKQYFIILVGTYFLLSAKCHSIWPITIMNLISSDQLNAILFKARQFTSLDKLHFIIEKYTSSVVWHDSYMLCLHCAYNTQITVLPLPKDKMDLYNIPKKPQVL